MNKKTEEATHIVIRSTGEEVEVAIFERGRLVRFEREDITAAGKFRKHALFVGKVVNHAKGINAIFINVGWKKNGLLPLEHSEIKVIPSNKQFFSSLTGYLYSQSPNEGHFARGEPVLVKIMREPLENKGPLLSTSVTVPGRYFVLLPFNKGILFARGAFSREEKEMYLAHIREVMRGDYGLIVRRHVAGKKISEVLPEIIELQQKWLNIIREIQAKWKKYPIQISEGESLAGMIVREYFPTGPVFVHINDDALVEEIKEACVRYSVELTGVKSYPQGSDIYAESGFDLEMARTFSRNVPFGNGAFLIIESGQLGHYIDVNSGALSTVYDDPEKMAFAVNMMAVDEIYRQITLRNLGGQIIIDFVTMQKEEHRKAVEEAMREAMAEEFGNYAMTPVNEFGIMVMTRKKRKAEYTPEDYSICEMCGGSGVSPPVASLVVNFQECIERIVKKSQIRYLKAIVNPLMEKYLRDGFPSPYMRLLWQYKIFINLTSDKKLPVNVFKFLDFDGNEILPGI